MRVSSSLSEEQREGAIGTLKSEIMDIYKKNHARYGHRHIHTELAKEGCSVAKKTVLKLMRALGLVCKARRKKLATLKDR